MNIQNKGSPAKPTGNPDEQILQNSGRSDSTRKEVGTVLLRDASDGKDATPQFQMKYCFSAGK